MTLQLGAKGPLQPNTTMHVSLEIQYEVTKSGHLGSKVVNLFGHMQMRAMTLIA
jgi:hypothetical protein